MKADKNDITYKILFEMSKENQQSDNIKEIEDMLEKVCKKVDIPVHALNTRNKTISIEFKVADYVNIGKVSKLLQRKLKEQGDTLENTIVITRSKHPAKQNVHVRGILEQIDEIAYYDLDEVCDEEEAFQAYIGDRPLTLIESGEQTFFIDEQALLSEIHLNCFECTKSFKYGCCAGSPCDMSKKNIKRFRQHEKAIEETMKVLNPAEHSTMKQYGGFLNKDGTIKEYEGRCSMLVDDQGIYKCVTHHYALEQGVPVYEICPLSCLMYPLEIIELLSNYRTKAILLTSAVQEGFAKTLSRWGSYEKLEVELRCLDKKAHNAQFKEANYRPVYKVNEQLLTHEFGSTVYSALKDLLEEK